MKMKDFVRIKLAQIKLEIVGYPNYVVAENKVYNRKTNRLIRRILKDGIEGYCLNSKFVRADKLKFQRPKDFECPF